ncbi:MAG: hypothetical protein H6732_16510 [Alphaproteobacteria bacterium]|nr:hypothetical protein [Alphaproteobacteria bacterium]
MTRRMLHLVVLAACMVAAPAAWAGKAPATPGKVFHHGVQIGPTLPILVHQEREDADWRASGGLGAKARWGWMLRLPAGAEGDVHTSGRYVFGGPWQGWQFVGGARVGPRFGTRGSNLFGLSILTGLDVRGDDTSRDGAWVGEAWSLGVPIMGKLRLAVVYLIGGVQPWFFVTDTSRASRDWARSEVAGFGDEMDVLAGIGFDVWILSVQLDANPRFTGYGTVVDLGLTVSFGFGPKG